MTDIAAARRVSALVPVLLTCVAYGYFNIGDAAVKILAQKYHFAQIVVLHCLSIILFMLPYGLWQRGRAALAVKNPRLVLLRAGLSAVVAVLNVLAFKHVQLTTFYTLVFTSPFWVAIFSSAFLGEKMQRRQMAVIVAGFVVILAILRPGGELWNVWSLAVLASAFVYAASMIVMRRMGPDENRVAIVCAGSAVSLLCALPFVFGNFQPLTLYDTGVFAVMGLLGSIGVSCIAYAFQTAPSAAVVAPYHYTQIVWGALLGYYMFDEVPHAATIGGAVMIIAAGLYLILHETRKKKNVDITAA